MSSSNPMITPDEEKAPVFSISPISPEDRHKHLDSLPQYASRLDDDQQSGCTPSGDPLSQPVSCPVVSGTPGNMRIRLEDGTPSRFGKDRTNLKIQPSPSDVENDYMACGPSQVQPAGLLTPPPTPPASRLSSDHPRNPTTLPLSNSCTSYPSLGKRKALCIGINYYDERGHKSELGSCYKDAKRMRHLLVKHFQYKNEDIVLLTDHPHHSDPETRPTRDNLLRAMKTLVHDARPGDSFFFHYSGHGFQTEDVDSDEDDGLDEVIYPMDYDVNGFIVDDHLHDIMIKPLPVGCRFTAVYDSCHSGSVLDLPYRYIHDLKDGIVKSQNEVAIVDKSSQADVICWSACTDYEDAQGTKDTGAMSSAFRAALEMGFTLDYKSVFAAIDEDIRTNQNLTQRPQLSCSHPLDISRSFTI